MDQTTQGRIRLLASVILKTGNYKFLSVAEQGHIELPYKQLSHEQKVELGRFFDEMWTSGFVMYRFIFSLDNTSEKVILSDFEHYEFVFTRQSPTGITFYTNNKIHFPPEFLQYIPSANILVT